MIFIPPFFSLRYILPIEPREVKTEAKAENGDAAATVEEPDKTSGPPRKKQKLTGNLRHYVSQEREGDRHSYLQYAKRECGKVSEAVYSGGHRFLRFQLSINI